VSHDVAVRPIEDTTILITGATDGLGRALAQRLAADGARLLLHGRDQERLDALESELGGRARTFRADFAALDDVRALADAVELDTDELHVLVNNAGIGSGLPEGRDRQVSRDGNELRFQVNYLAGYLLTERLLPLLRRSAPARVVLVSSLGQAPLDFDDVMLERDYDGSRAYSQSKLAQIAYGFALAERLPAAEVTVNSLHPSTYMPTKMVLAERGASLDTLERGVDATLRLVTAPELEGVTGRFFDREQEARAHPWAYDEVNSGRLLALSDSVVA
jgi:NAD(P)-dependent dehydrogenase (short-subunit alcohol dehydrogenase family)